MTELEWMTCNDPEMMLEVVRGPISVVTKTFFGREVPFQGYFHRRTSDRKLRLFACACCHRRLSLLDDEHCKKLVEVGQELGYENLNDVPLDSCRRALELAERAADEIVADEDLRTASEITADFDAPACFYAACYGEHCGPYDTELMASGCLALAVSGACDTDPASGVGSVVSQIGRATAYLSGSETGEMEGGDPAENAILCELLREIMGNPFRKIAVNPDWQTPKVLELAQSIYEGRNFDQMKVLAERLEKSGCNDPDILAHCHQSNEHVRGCWLLDLLLGKE